MRLPFALTHPYFAARGALHRFETRVLRVCPGCKKRRPVKTRRTPIFGTHPSYMWHDNCAFPPAAREELRRLIETGEIPTRKAYRNADGTYRVQPRGPMVL